jgi:hypothetical protein
MFGSIVKIKARNGLFVFGGGGGTCIPCISAGSGLCLLPFFRKEARRLIAAIDLSCYLQNRNNYISL